MNIKYLPSKKRVGFDVCDLLQKHDLVFLSPVCDPMYGLPIGDGDTGLLLYFTPSSLNIAVNKTDLYSDGGSEDVLAFDTKAVHGASVSVDFGCPVFDNIYAEEFEARLNLSDATATVRDKTPFADIELSAFASHGERAAIISGRVSYSEKTPFSVRLERWGCRMFKYWYSEIRGSCSDGLDGTASAVGDGRLDITQRLDDRAFCVSVKVIGDAASKGGLIFKTAGSHAAKCEFDPSDGVCFSLCIAVGTGADALTAKKAAHAKIDGLLEKGRETVYTEHNQQWRGFWNKSFVSLPERLDFIENLWYLDLYYANSSMRGVSPSYFCGGIWGAYHDFVPWEYFFHYNMQLATLPLESAAHPELLETYYDFRLRQLPIAREYAKTVRGGKGVFYTDVCDRAGRMGLRDDNCTCGTQIAMALYNHYLYSKDGAYLEKILPLLTGVGEFYLDMLVLKDDGCYHIEKTLGYEGSPLLDDSITDLAAVRCLFAALIAVLPEGESAIYKERLEKLVPYSPAGFYDGEVENGVFLHGIGKGRPIAAQDVLSVGVRHDGGEVMRRTFGLEKYEYYGFPDTEMAPVFPCGTVGVKDRGTLLYNRIKNSIYLHHPTVVQGKTPDSEYDGMCMGWCMMPIYMARMGMAAELEKQLTDSAEVWTAFPQGFSQEGPYTSFTPDNTERWHKYRCADYSRGQNGEDKAGVPSWNFRHFSYEALPVITAAVNEMLMQSCDGVIRLFPAINPDGAYSFTLAAAGGYTVTAMYDGGDNSGIGYDGIGYDVYIESKFDGVCCFALPEDFAEPCVTDALTGAAVETKHADGTYTVAVNKGGVIRICSPNADAVNFDVGEVKRNGGMKSLGKAQLGEERSFSRAIT